MTPDDLTAPLQPVKDRAGVFAKLGPPRPSDSAAVNAAFESAADVPVLVAALEEALKKAADWDAEAKRIDDKFADEESAWSRTVADRRAQAFEWCARTLREAVTRVLKGESATETPAACPESKMDDGSHSDELAGGCAWCGASAEELEGGNA